MNERQQKKKKEWKQIGRWIAAKYFKVEYFFCKFNKNIARFSNINTGQFRRYSI